MNLSLSGKGSLLKVGSFSFGSPVSASAVSKPIFETKANKYKTKTYTSMVSGSGKNVLYFGSLAASSLQKSSGGGFTAYSSTSALEGFKFGSSMGGWG